MSEPGVSPAQGSAAEGVEAAATAAINGANPFVGLNRQQLAAAVARWGGSLMRQPLVLASRVAGLTGEQLRVLAGTSDLAPDPKDRRFADPAWNNPVWRRVAQSYLGTREAVLGSVDELDLDGKSADRARFALMQVTEAMAPTNALAGNPAAMKRAVSTRGRSLAKGARNWVSDVRHNGGMPSQVDTRPFTVGGNLAVSPGAVVFRNDVLELIQYEPTTPTVRPRPVMIVPPQINKFYFLDLAPGRSFIEHAVAQGLQIFAISWRNPTPAQRDWSLDTYVAACVEAAEVTCDIAGTDDLNVIGFCAGGITQSLLMGHLAAIGRDLVASSTLAVTTIDTEAKSSMNMFATRRTVESSIAQTRRKGILAGRDLARVFAWVRPNDLVWNYWVSNYLLGEDPPAFDVLAWNSDTTNLPAALHAEFVHLFLDNALVEPGKISVLGTPVDLSKVVSDLYVIGATTDHLVPWQAAYVATQVYGGKSRYVLSNSGHIQALINPPGNPKASFLTSDETPPGAEVWLKGATRYTGSWWTDWAEWTIERSGEEIDAPTRLGNERHVPSDPAPGRNVREQ
jgi:polyhydroxyalkanoate synthase